MNHQWELLMYHVSVEMVEQVLPACVVEFLKFFLWFKDFCSFLLSLDVESDRNESTRSWSIIFLSMYG